MRVQIFIAFLALLVPGCDRAKQKDIATVYPVQSLCAGAWEAVKAGQRSQLNKADFLSSCARIDWVALCNDGFVDMSDNFYTICSKNGGKQKLLKGVDA